MYNTRPTTTSEFQYNSLAYNTSAPPLTHRRPVRVNPRRSLSRSRRPALRDFKDAVCRQMGSAQMGIRCSPFFETFCDPSMHFWFRNILELVSSNWGPLTVSVRQYPWNSISPQATGTTSTSAPSRRSTASGASTSSGPATCSAPWRSPILLYYYYTVRYCSVLQCTILLNN